MCTKTIDQLIKEIAPNEDDKILFTKVGVSQDVFHSRDEAIRHITSQNITGHIIEETFCKSIKGYILVGCLIKQDNDKFWILRFDYP